MNAAALDSGRSGSPRPSRIRRLPFRGGVLICGGWVLLALFLFSCHPLVRPPEWRRTVFHPNGMGIEILWSAQLTDREMMDYHPIEEGGLAADDKAVYVGGRNGYLVKLDRLTGRELGRRAIGKELFGQPLLHNDLLILPSTGMLTAYQKDDLKARPKWAVRLKAEIVAPMVIAEGREDLGKHILYLITQEDTLIALDADTGRFLWERREDFASPMTIRTHAAPVIDGEMLYQGLTSGSMMAVNRFDGRVIWMRELGTDYRFNDVNATPTVKDGMIFTASFDGGIYALTADNGIVLWRTDLKSVSAPLWMDGKLYLTASESGFYCLDAENGQIEWYLELKKLYMDEPEGALTPPMLYKEHYFVFASSGAGLYVLDWTRQELVERFTPGNGISSLPLVSGNQIFLLSNGGAAYSVELARLGNPNPPKLY